MVWLAPLGFGGWRRLWQAKHTADITGAHLWRNRVDVEYEERGEEEDDATEQLSREETASAQRVSRVQHDQHELRL